MRKTKNSPVLMKLWRSYTLDSTEDTVPWLCALSAGLAAAEYRSGDFYQVYIDAHIVDWRPTGGEPALEYSFEVLSDWRNRLDVLDVAKAFDKAANKKMKEYKV
jgi:hypothetical protein